MFLERYTKGIRYLVGTLPMPRLLTQALGSSYLTTYKLQRKEITLKESDEESFLKGEEVEDSQR